MNRKLIILLFCFYSLHSFGQIKEFVFKGKVIDADKNTAVAFASIKIVDQGSGVASDEKGNFSFAARVGEQIRVSSIGYHPQMLIITEDYLNTEEVILIRLLPKTYELDSIEVIQLRDNFYLKKPIWDTLDIKNPYLSRTPRNWDNVNTIGNTDGSAGFAITGFLNSFDKDLQQRKYLQRIKEAQKFREERKVELEKRFNKAMVKRITRIDDRVIDEFMTFCDFRDGVILRSTEYELTKLILEKYRLFLLR